MSNLVFTVSLKNSNICITESIEVTNLITNKGVLPFIKLNKYKNAKAKYVRVFLNAQLWEKWKQSGFQVKITRARVKDTLPKTLIASSQEKITERETAIILIEELSRVSPNENIIAWTKHQDKYEVLLLVKQGQVIKLKQNLYLNFDGKKLKKLVEL